eukprot:m.84644 g.84644  ORF g.84644 m.84644 type:complete len:522 (+) comp12163_c0_seq2:56-1621(+)
MICFFLFFKKSKEQQQTTQHNTNKQTKSKQQTTMTSMVSGDIRYLPWFRKPKARQEGDDHHQYERRPTLASYLVLDLTIARAFGNLGTSFEQAIRGDGEANVSIGIFFALFLPMYFQWLHTQHFTNRFDNEDMIMIVHFAVNMLLMAYAGTNIGTCATLYEQQSDETCPQYTGSIATLRFVHILYLVFALVYNKRYSTFLWRQIITSGITCLLWIICTFITGTTVDIIWWVIIGLEFLFFLTPHFLPNSLTIQSQDKPRLHPDLLAARHNRFTIIGMAFIVGGVLSNLGGNGQGAVSSSFTFSEGVAVTCACLIVVGLKMQYFDLLDVSRPSDNDNYGSTHAVVRDPVHSRYRVLWEISHFFLNMATVLVGTTLKLYVMNQETRLERRWLCTPLAGASLVTIFQQSLSSGGIGGYRKRRLTKLYRLLCRLFGIVVTFILPFIFTPSVIEDDDGFAAIVALWFLGTIVFDVWARMPSKNRILREKDDEAELVPNTPPHQRNAVTEQSNPLQRKLLDDNTQEL